MEHSRFELHLIRDGGHVPVLSDPAQNPPRRDRIPLPRLLSITAVRERDSESISFFSHRSPQSHPFLVSQHQRVLGGFKHSSLSLRTCHGDHENHRTRKGANTEKQDLSSKGGAVSLDSGKTKLTCDGSYSRHEK